MEKQTTQENDSYYEKNKNQNISSLENNTDVILNFNKLQISNNNKKTSLNNKIQNINDLFNEIKWLTGC